MEITCITVGETNSYFLHGTAGTMLIDPGPVNAAQTIISGAAANGIRPADVKLILVTHGHLDHYGSVQPIQDWCRAPVAAHPQAPAYSKEKRNAVPPAQTLRGSLARWLYLMLLPASRLPPLTADMFLEDGERLQPAPDLDGHIMYVPGHSPDSLAFITDNGEAFVGDLITNYAVPSQPLYLWDQDVWQESLQRLRAVDPQTVRVGHGNPFPGEQLNKIYPPRYQWRWWVR